MPDLSIPTLRGVLLYVPLNPFEVSLQFRKSGLLP